MPLCCMVCILFSMVCANCTDSGVCISASLMIVSDTISLYVLLQLLFSHSSLSLGHAVRTCWLREPKYSHVLWLSLRMQPRCDDLCSTGALRPFVNSTGVSSPVLNRARLL